MSRIKCTVDECHFWGSGNRCTADEIEVSYDQTVSEDMEIADFDQARFARTSTMTCCRTFRPKLDYERDAKNQKS